MMGTVLDLSRAMNFFVFSMSASTIFDAVGRHCVAVLPVRLAHGAGQEAGPRNSWYSDV